jgi:hypothetical protein
MVPFLQLLLEDQHHVFQHAEEHQRIRLGLMFDQDIDGDVSGQSSALGIEQRRVQHHVRFQVPVITMHEAGGGHPHAGEVDAREQGHVEDVEQIADVLRVFQQDLEAILGKMADHPLDAFAGHGRLLPSVGAGRLDNRGPQGTARVYRGTVSETGACDERDVRALVRGWSSIDSRYAFYVRTDSTSLTIKRLPGPTVHRLPE